MEKTMIALPNGEWWDALEMALVKSGVRLERASKRSYRIDMPDQGITGVMTRTKDIPAVVDDPNSKTVIGITGSDILIETGRRKLLPYGLKNPDYVIPLQQLVPTAPRPKIYVALTPNCPLDYDSMDRDIQSALEGVHRHSISRNTTAMV